MRNNRNAISINAMKYRIPEDVIKIMERLSESGYESYLVGGCVRDMLLDITPSDYDIGTQATPEDVAEIFASQKIISTGRDHGTTGVVMNGLSYEITTFRIDGKYSDSRHPDSVSFTRKIEEDLERRDFTVNAIAMSLDGSITDPTDGIKDLQNGVLRAVGDPACRFTEDALRMMRAVRFVAQFGFTVEEKTDAAIHRCKDGLRGIAVERIRTELEKLLISPYPDRGLRKYRDVIEVFIPELADAFDFDQKTPYHCYDVYEHILHTVSSAPRDIVIRTAALLHDIGKPACFTTERGRGHFYGHEKVSADMAATVMRRLRFDSATVKDVRQLIENHGTVFNPTAKYARRKLAKFGERHLRQLIELEKADVSAQAYEVREERFALLSDFSEIVDKTICEQQCFSLKQLAVSGDDLLAEGIPEGERIGRALDMLLDAVIDGKVQNNRAECLRFLSESDY